jgi:hypothetical protein
MQYLFQHTIPIPWLLADILTLLLTLWVVAAVIKKHPYPAVALLECFGFVFLYASIFENFAVVQGWYIYGRSLLMIGDVPLSVPLIEMDVLLLGLWMLDKMQIPEWTKPFIVGLLGMLQDFSLDPVAVNQIFTSPAGTTGRWTWLLDPGVANIYHIPVYNFPGWMLIMLYGSTYVLLGRWWFRRSGYNPVIGYVYPYIAFVLALITMVSPASQLLLWLAPFFAKGSFAEWIMLAFHLAFPTFLLIYFWRGKMKTQLTLAGDLPVFTVPLLFHISDILFALSGGFSMVLWLVVASSIIHLVLLGWVYFTNTRLEAQIPV